MSTGLQCPMMQSYANLIRNKSSCKEGLLQGNCLQQLPILDFASSQSAQYINHTEKMLKFTSTYLMDINNIVNDW